MGLSFFSIKPPLACYWHWKGEVASLPFLSDSYELVQSCLSSTREMSEQKVLVSMEQHFTGINKFLTAEGVQPSGILQRLEKQFEEACLSRTWVFDWCTTFREGREREWKTCCIIIDRKHQSSNTLLTFERGSCFPPLPLRKLWACSVLSKLYKRDDWTESVG